MRPLALLLRIVGIAPPAGPALVPVPHAYAPSWPGLAAATTLAAAIRSLHYELTTAEAGTLDDDELHWHIEDARHAVALPLLLAAGLLIFFWWFKELQFVLLAAASAGAVVALHFAVSPVLDACTARWRWRWPAVQLCLPACCACRGGRPGLQLPARDAALCGAAVALVLCWLATGSLALNNCIGIAFALSLPALVRLPNLKARSAGVGAAFPNAPGPARPSLQQ